MSCPYGQGVKSLLNFILLLAAIACIAFSIVIFGEMVISENKGKLFVLRPNDDLCDIIRKHCAENNLDAEEFIYTAIRNEITKGDGYYVPRRKD